MNIISAFDKILALAWEAPADPLTPQEASALSDVLYEALNCASILGNSELAEIEATYKERGKIAYDMYGRSMSFGRAS